MYLYHSNDNHFDLLIPDNSRIVTCGLLGRAPVAQVRDQAEKVQSQEPEMQVHGQVLQAQGGRQEEVTAGLEEARQEVARLEAAWLVAEEARLVLTKQQQRQEEQHQEDQEVPKDGDVEEEQELTCHSEESWRQVDRIGSRYRCPTCGFTRNTKNQMDKHMKEHQEDIDDCSFTCRHCPYQTNSRNQLENHIKTTHEPSIQNSNICFQCNKSYMSKPDLKKHIQDTHKNYKPCDYFSENRCELDGDCKYNHIKLLKGQEICYKCGLFFKSKGELRKHIIAKHGNILCHKFLNNLCTQQRCFFSHNVMTATSVVNTPEPNKTPIITPQDFPSLPTIRPVVGGQMAAMEAENQYQHQIILQVTQKVLTQMTPIIVQQIMQTMLQ